jgi:hypothetical protein
MNRLRRVLFGVALVPMLFGCDKSPTSPSPVRGLNGHYEGTFVADAMLVVNISMWVDLHQQTDTITGSYNPCCYQQSGYSLGGQVTGKVETPSDPGGLSRFTARFKPDDVGDRFDLDTLTSVNGDSFSGRYAMNSSYPYGDSSTKPVHGTATFVRTGPQPILYPFDRQLAEVLRGSQVRTATTN